MFQFPAKYTLLQRDCAQGIRRRRETCLGFDLDHHVAHVVRCLVALAWLDVQPRCVCRRCMWSETYSSSGQAVVQCLSRVLYMIDAGYAYFTRLTLNGQDHAANLTWLVPVTSSTSSGSM